MRNSFRVAVVDDNEDMPRLVKDILQGADDLSYAGGFSNGVEALNGLPQMHPDLVLMDIRLPDINGIECTKRLKRIMPGLKIIMFSGLLDARSVIESVQAGAVDFLTKPLDTDQCVVTLLFHACGGKGLTQATDLDSSPGTVPRAHKRLSPREDAFMQCLAKCLHYKEIPDEMGISYSAMRKLQHRVYVKLHARDRAEAIATYQADNRS